MTRPKSLTLTVPEAGDLVGISRGSAYEAARRGEIPTIRLGGRLVVPKAKLLQMLGALSDDQDPTSSGAVQKTPS